MAARTCAVAAEVFARFPHYLRGVVVAHGVRNGPSSPELVALLREAEASVRERLQPEEITTHPRIASWRAAFKAQGINPKDFRCSVEAMARRALEAGRDILASVEFTHDSLESSLRSGAVTLGIKAGQMFQPIRVAVCGRKNAPPLFATLEALGREISLQRIDQAIQKLKEI